MKKKLLWALLAIAVIVILILALALPRDDRGDKAAESVETQAEPTAEQPVEAAAQQTAESETVTIQVPEHAPGELPMDTSSSGTVTGTGEIQPAPSGEQEEAAPATDPATGMELDEDELPLDTP